MQKILLGFSQLLYASLRFFYPQKPRLKDHVRVLFIFAFLGFLAVTSFLYFWIDLTPVKAMKNFKPALPSRLLDRKGRLITRFFVDNRILIAHQDIPLVFIEALVATEDNHFFAHRGIDMQAIFRAFLKNLTAGEVRQGGSTITQQLAKIILTNRERSLTRKIKEAVYAVSLDYLFTKEEILTLYVNQIYLGHGNYGIEAASRFYFGKSAQDLRVGEAALLAGLTNAPNRYSPVRHPHLARERLAYVLRKMINMNFISPQTAKEEFAAMEDYIQTLNISPETSAFGIRQDLAGYFSETVRRMLVKELGEKLLYEGGLTIYSSLDLDHQRIAQEKLWQALEKQNKVSRRNLFTGQLKFSERYGEQIRLLSLLYDLPEFWQKRGFNNYQTQLYFFEHLADKMELLNFGIVGLPSIDNFLNKIRDINPYQNQFSAVEGAFIEIDHQNGDITAMVGGTPFSAVNQINRTYQISRQPGSTFKPLLYAAALDLKKITVATIYPDTPLILKDVDGSSWIPENYSGGFRGFISVREALTNSVNMISINIAREIGLSSLLPILAKELDVKMENIPANLSVALGSYEVSPLQMARAFSVFARGGISLTPVYIHKIIDGDGKVIRNFEQLNPALTASEKKVISPETASIMVDLLKDVVNKGTGKSIRSLGYTGFAAGKTGTTNNFRDAWFVGFNQRYSAAVWVGYDRPTLNLGSGQAGGVVAAPIWGRYQVAAQKYMPKENSVKFAPLTRALICPISGKLVREDSPIAAQEEIFIPGTEPTEICDLDHSYSGDFGQSFGKERLTGYEKKSASQSESKSIGKSPTEKFFESDGF